ncbi:MAG: hypothetical protein GY745_22130, partial [Actinomycetia bacterium]|nr:hypothetical protein [Actinomycetes bacterium]
MGWSIVESFVESKVDGRESEDVVVASAHFAAVIDGATDETGALFAGKSGGRFAAETLASAIEDLDEHTDATEFTDRLTAALSAGAGAAGPLSPDTRWPSASLICLSFSRNEIWRIGDCNFMIDHTPNIGTKRVDAAAYSFRAAINAALLAAGAPLNEILSNDPGSAAARPLFDLQQQLTNRAGPW